MAIDTAMVMATYVMPAIKSILMLIFGLGGSAGLAYYLFVIKRRRKWHVNIWEKKADGSLQLIQKDILFEKRINKGKQLIYMFKFQKLEAFPPPWECVYRIKGKEYCDYLRLREDFLPLNREIEGVTNMPNSKSGIIKKVRGILKNIRGTSIKDKTKTENEFIHIPIHNALTVDVKFKPMDYDVNMMRINALDLREKIYADKQDFLQKYGVFIAFGMIVVLIIVVLYLSYDYNGNVIAMAMGEAQKTAGMLEKVASQIGGVPPPQ